MKKRAIFISGKQGSGKSTLANKLEEMLWQSPIEPVRMKFADPIYSLHDGIWDFIETCGLKKKKCLPKGETVDGRLLQLLGTEWGRTMMPNIWANILRKRLEDIEGRKLAIIDDCRFPNELNVMTRGFSLRVRLECIEGIRRDRAEKWRHDVDHISETALDGREEYFDVVFDSGLTSTQSMAEKIIPLIL